jgi:hypothetical protein
MRAQVTLEWLMLGLVALSLLAIASVAISRAQSAQTTLAERKILQLQVEELGYYADQICVLGEGNARVVPLSPMGFELNYDAGAKTLNMSKGADSTLRTTLCTIQADADGYSSKAYLKFGRDATSNRPIVRISNQP